MNKPIEYGLHFPDNFKLKDLYDFDCIGCGKGWRLEPGMMMRDFGINMGHATCKLCKTFMYAAIEFETNTVKVWEHVHAEISQVKLSDPDAVQPDTSPS